MVSSGTQTELWAVPGLTLLCSKAVPTQRASDWVHCRAAGQDRDHSVVILNPLLSVKSLCKYYSLIIHLIQI